MRIPSNYLEKMRPSIWAWPDTISLAAFGAVGAAIAPWLIGKTGLDASESMGAVLVDLLQVGGLAVGAFFLIKLLWCRYWYTYYLFEDRVVVDKGIIAKKTPEVEYRNIKAVDVEKRWHDRLFGVGTVSLSTAGSGGVDAQIFGIKEPYQVRERIRDLLVLDEQGGSDDSGPGDDGHGSDPVDESRLTEDEIERQEPEEKVEARRERERPEPSRPSSSNDHASIVGGATGASSADSAGSCGGGIDGGAGGCM